jgi:methyl-accepting chemotaxis protein
MNQQIAQTTVQQSTVTKNVLSSLDAIRQETEAFLSSSSEVSESSRRLSSLSESLDELVKQYR